VLTVILQAALVVTILYNHTDDGNVFGIYIKGADLHLGDFWGAAFIVALCYSIVEAISGWF